MLSVLVVVAAEKIMTQVKAKQKQVGKYLKKTYRLHKVDSPGEEEPQWEGPIPRPAETIRIVRVDDISIGEAKGGAVHI